MPEKSIVPYITFLSILFVTTTLTGYLVPLEFQKDLVREVTSFFAPLKSLTPLKIFFYIFLNNFIKALLSILLGFFFGLIPLLFIIGNGYILGMIISFSLPHMSPGNIALRILPHGIFEIPGFIIAASYGCLLGMMFYRKLRYKEPFQGFFVLALKKFTLLVGPLLLIAALIEAFITPLLISIAA